MQYQQAIKTVNQTLAKLCPRTLTFFLLQVIAHGKSALKDIFSARNNNLYITIFTNKYI